MHGKYLSRILMILVDNSTTGKFRHTHNAVGIIHSVFFHGIDPVSYTHLDVYKRQIFYARGVLETVKKLRWCPDVIHCHGWMTALAPLYICLLYTSTSSNYYLGIKDYKKFIEFSDSLINFSKQIPLYKEHVIAYRCV